MINKKMDKYGTTFLTVDHTVTPFSSDSDSPVISYWLHCGCDKLYKTAAIIYTYILLLVRR